MPNRTCDKCETLFVSADIRQRFCCKDCRLSWYRQEKDRRRIPACVTCANPIVGRRRNARFCSNACGRKQYQRDRRERLKSARPDRPCRYCGAPVHGPSTRPHQQFCSATHRGRWHHLTNAYGPNGPALGFRIDSGTECQNVGCHDQATVVDHCHETGRNRWLLCNNCNAALGLLREDAERVQGLGLLLQEADEAQWSVDQMRRAAAGQLISDR